MQFPLLGALAQRLVRVLCDDCKQPYQPSDSESRMLGLAPDQEATLYHPTGCEHCNHQGYRGRTGIFELMTVDDKIRALITQQARSSDLHACATENGMLALHDDALRKVEKNVTTIAEVQRVSVA